MVCEYCGEGTYGRIITKKVYWTIYLAPSQRYLGTCVIALNRPCINLSELENVEWKEFSELVR
jgi:diadenosine tetraphosphate (Ap4A) HIT family hydrolase